MIAISYRREDSLPITGRLYDRLQAKFGQQHVFMDFDSIPPGVDFREQIKRTIERSNLVIAVIGPRWLGEQADSSRRIDDPTDFVRLEIKYALEKGIPVIPLLVDNTLMPKPEKLPPELEALAFRNALPLDSGIDFHTHAERLINGICSLVDVSEKRRDTPQARKIRSEATTRPRVQAGPLRRSRIPAWSTFGVIVAAGVALSWWLIARYDREQPTEDKKETTFLNESNTKEVALAGTNEDKKTITSLNRSNTREVAVIETSEGEMVADLWPDVAPKTVENFKKLAKAGFYDGTAFHRVIKGFMIQGGDPLTRDERQKTAWGTGDPGYKIAAEFNEKSHERGVLSMARSQDPNSAGSQFFICHGSARFLDGQYTAFGKLIRGDEVLGKIGDAEVTTSSSGEKSLPTKRITVERIKIVPAELAK
jgi:peptidyl-prolyl cis-trans isomerase B (cyclophilin B)